MPHFIASEEEWKVKNGYLFVFLFTSLPRWRHHFNDRL